jgi:hypothetical protein
MQSRYNVWFLFIFMYISLFEFYGLVEQAVPMFTKDGFH